MTLSEYHIHGCKFSVSQATYALVLTIYNICKGLAWHFRVPASILGIFLKWGKHGRASQHVLDDTFFFADFCPCHGSLGFCCFMSGEVGCAQTNTTHGLRRAWALLLFVLLGMEARTLYMLGKCSVTEKCLELWQRSSVSLDMSPGCGHVPVNISALMSIKLRAPVCGPAAPIVTRVSFKLTSIAGGKKKDSA